MWLHSMRFGSSAQFLSHQHPPGGPDQAAAASSHADQPPDSRWGPQPALLPETCCLHGHRRCTSGAHAAKLASAGQQMVQHGLLPGRLQIHAQPVYMQAQGL